MIVGNIENGLEHGFVKHCLKCLLITDPKSYVTLGNQGGYQCDNADLVNVLGEISLQKL